MASTIHEALMAVQSELKAPKGQTNKFGGYKYRSCEDILEAVKPILKAHGLVLRLSDKPIVVEGWHYIEATATVESSDNGSYTVTAYAREPETKKGMDDSQVTGTASSYARKYALNGLFCIDDTKDADTDEYQKQTGGGKKPDKKPEPKIICADCGREVMPMMANGKMYSAEDIAKNTNRTYKRILCWECASKQRQPKEG